MNVSRDVLNSGVKREGLEANSSRPRDEVKATSFRLADRSGVRVRLRLSMQLTASRLSIKGLATALEA